MTMLPSFYCGHAGNNFPSGVYNRLISVLSSGFSFYHYSRIDCTGHVFAERFLLFRKIMEPPRISIKI